ncbi:glycosyltransferase family 2 protein [Candidatus Dependentiae bacterium]|nr:MAG: glycosyltransferase family 2 protein [Candidatus Dependentiae bacterium]
MSKLFTIVFPTRGRLQLLEKILDSILFNTANLANIEVLIAIDSDDLETQEFFQNKLYCFVKTHIVERSLNFSRDYYSYLAKQGTGKWIIACNDDARFETKDWDLIAERVLNEYIGTGANIVHGWIEDNLNEYRAKGHGKYCCFPLIGRDGFEALGYVFPERIPTWGADIWIRKLYDNVDRVVDLPITIAHYCHHNNTREQDDISIRIANNQVGFDVEPTYNEINALLKGLRDAQKSNV